MGIEGKPVKEAESMGLVAVHRAPYITQALDTQATF